MIILNDGDWCAEPAYSVMAPRYIANESAYSILSRFAECNAIKSAKLVNVFCNRVHLNRLTTTKNLSCLFSVDINKMEQHLRLSKAEVYKLFLTPSFVTDMGCTEENLKYCPYCLAQHRHYTIFQLIFIHECPLHRVPLIQRCPTCRAAISNKLEASTFKLPYGCPYCETRFAAVSPSRRQFCTLNRAGERLFQAFSDAIVLKSDNLLQFSFQRQTSTYCDNVLCLSKSLEDAERSERIFFYWLMRSISEEDIKGQLSKYPKYVLKPHQLTLRRSEPIDDEWFIQSLFAIFKSVSRHVIRALKASRCLRKVSRTLWWVLSGSELPQACPKILAFIGWRVFWLNARTPADTLHPGRRGRSKIRAWLQSIAQDRTIALFPSAQRSWLISHIFISALVTTLDALSEPLIRSADEGNVGEVARWPLCPLPSSHCWAAYIDNTGVSSITTFMPGPRRHAMSDYNLNVTSHPCCCAAGIGI